MPEGRTPDMLVVVDEQPGSLAGVRIAAQYARGAIALTSWEAEAPEADQVRTSIAALPTIDEAFRMAAQHQLAWIGLRRDFAEPATLLGEILVATGRHNDDDNPGFAVFLADGDPTPFRRILAIVDHRTGPISGLLAYASVAVADTANAVLDVLVIGTTGQSLASEDEADLLAISREQELFDRALARAVESELTVNWLPAAEVTHPWWVIRDQLRQHDYDLVIDDLGDLELGGRIGLERTIEAALAPGKVGEIPLRLLSETDLPVLLVVDEIRLGIAPRSILKAGTVAALSLGMISAAPLSATAPTVAALGRTEQDPDPIGELVNDLEQALEESAPETDAVLTRQRETEALDASRGGGESSARYAAEQALHIQQPAVMPASSSEEESEESTDDDEDKKGAQEPKPPKGGANPSDVAKAAKQAAEAKAALAESKEARAEADEAHSEATAALDTATAGARVSLADLEASSLSLDAATAYSGQLQSETTGLTGLLPGGATAEQVATAEVAAGSAQGRLDASTAAAGAALEALNVAKADAEQTDADLTQANADVEEARADYAYAKEKVEVYRESLAESRQSPVAKGYNLTARFGDTGWHWSSGVHTGLDFAGSTGTDVMAAASGTVIEAGWAGAYGNRIVIDHGDGYSTTYNHLSATRVSVGDKVRTGERIGDLGGTGNVTGPHLHFEVLKGKKFVNPEDWLGW